MKILFFGDIVGQPGRLATVKILPELKQELAPDLVFANAENIAHGQGLSQKSLKELIDAGVDFFTSGDHAFALKEGALMLESKIWPILRPLNWPNVPGRGFEIINCGAKRILLMNLIGRVFMKQHLDDPFKAASELLDDYSLKGRQKGTQAVDAILIDLHAEATSEKAALAWRLDGRVSAVIGTHTHVPTADERVLPGGSAFISDIGMAGVQNSVLGSDAQIVIKRFLTQRLYKIEVARGGPAEVNSVLITLDEKTGLAQNIERVRKIVALD